MMGSMGDPPKLVCPSQPGGIGWGWGWGHRAPLAVWAAAVFGGLRKPSLSLILFPEFLQLQTVGSTLSFCSGLQFVVSARVGVFLGQSFALRPVQLMLLSYAPSSSIGQVLLFHQVSLGNFQLRRTPLCILHWEETAHRLYYYLSAHQLESSLGGNVPLP